MMNDRLRIVVMGYIVRGPLAGLAWHHLQYVMGLAALGHAVCYIEDSGESVGCYDPARGITDENPEYGLQFTAQCFAGVGLEKHWAYYNAPDETWHGPCAGSALRICAEADILIDLSPMDPIRPWIGEIPRRILIDTDPAFNQIDHLQNPALCQRARKFTSFFSFGENFGKPGCSIPDDGFFWQPTRQPVVLDAWKVTPGPQDGMFTSVMVWDSYRVREHAGVQYGMKSASFRPYLDLPSRTGCIFDLALGGSNVPRADLSQSGWKLGNPLDVSRDLETYQEFIRQSRGEFTVAKQGYVASHSGWFSERSAVYLASGRPVLVEDTGFSEWLPTGSGVVAFRTPDEAAAGVDKISGDYGSHCRAARAIAEEYFDSRKVLTHLLERSMN